MKIANALDKAHRKGMCAGFVQDHSWTDASDDESDFSGRGETFRLGVWSPGLTSSAGGSARVVITSTGQWLRAHTYAASADSWSGVSCAPPMGGIGLRYSFGCATPSLMVFKIPA
jgi:hypothetical protein